MSHASFPVVCRQVAATCRQLCTQPGFGWAHYLPAAAVHRAVREAGGVFRERLFTPAVTLWTFLTQLLDENHSCRQAVARLLAFRVACGLPPCSPDTGAYCKARARLPEEALARLTRATGRDLMDQADGQWLWKGRRVQVVDGTALSMPDTPENAKEYPKQRNLPPGVGFPLLRLVVVFSLAVGTALDAAMGPLRGKKTGEVSLFRALRGVLEAGDVLLADRLYATFWDVARAVAAGVDVVMRLHASRAAVWFGGRGHGTGNRRVWWRKPPRPEWMSPADYDALPEWLRLRAVRVDVRQRGFRTRQFVVVTTLTDAAAYTGEDIAELYRRRWQAELYLRSLKTTLQMDILRGQTPAVVRNEVWGHLLAYNVIRTVMAQGAATAGVRPDQLSFAGALQTVNAFLPHLRTARTLDEAAALWGALVVAVAYHRVGNRPDRIEPRAVKRRPKHYPKLAVPRAEARRRLKRRVKPVGKRR